MSVSLCLPLRYDVGAVAEVEPIKYADSSLDEDAGLISRAREGDYRAFEDLVCRYRNDVFALCYHYVRNREDAWDLSQEVFVKAHRSLKGFRGEARFKTWLLRVAANQCKDFFKKRRLKTVALDQGERVIDVPSSDLDPKQQLEARELGHSIQKALDTLSETHRRAFILREFEGLSYDEMAHVMRCSPGTVMSRLHNARKKLQTALIEMGVVEGR